MMPLVDGYGRLHTYLRIAVTDRCNLRCSYCMPPRGAVRRRREEILTLEEIVRVARLCVAAGVTKIRLTGGEPTMRRDLDVLIRRLADTPGLHTLGMTTNGVRLKTQARALKAGGVTALNISLDTLQPERFTRLTGQEALPDVLAGIEAALDAGFTTVKLNTVVMTGVNDDELLDFVAFVRDKPVSLRFIEFMPFTGNGWNARGLLPASEMVSRIQARYPLRFMPDATPGASAHAYAIDGFRATIGFITPMSHAFCAHCSRLRLTADGSVKSCLFAPAEVNLRDLLREGAPDELLMASIRQALARKAKAHPAADELITLEDRPMTLIGG